jgi:CheY-like chemotaxis protein
MMAELLGKQRILIVEDDWVVAQNMSDMIEELGGAVVGPAGQLAQGLALAESEELGGAILDVNLNGENTFALADRLLAESSQPAMTRRCCPSASLTSPGSRSPSLPSLSRRPFAGYLRTTSWEVARPEVNTCEMAVAPATSCGSRGDIEQAQVDSQRVKTKCKEVLARWPELPIVDQPDASTES